MPVWVWGGGYSWCLTSIWKYATCWGVILPNYQGYHTNTNATLKSLSHVIFSQDWMGVKYKTISSHPGHLRQTKTQRQKPWSKVLTHCRASKDSTNTKTKTLPRLQKSRLPQDYHSESPLVSYLARCSISFILGPLHWSSIFPTRKEHKNIVQLCTTILSPAVESPDECWYQSHLRSNVVISDTIFDL